MTRAMMVSARSTWQTRRRVVGFIGLQWLCARWPVAPLVSESAEPFERPALLVCFLLWGERDRDDVCPDAADECDIDSVERFGWLE